MEPDPIASAATDEDLARWKTEFRALFASVWIPGWHLHEKSECYVDGIRPNDGCWICDNQWPLVHDAMLKGEVLPTPLAVVIPERMLAAMKRRMDIYGFDRSDYEDPELRQFICFGEPPTYDGKDTPAPSMVFESKPTRDDITRWRKQFTKIIEFLTKRAAKEEEERAALEKKRKFTSKNMEDDELMEVPSGPLQMGVFGGAEVISLDRKRKKRR